MAETFKIESGQALLAGERAGEGRALVLLHAGVADRRMWRPQMTDLSDSFLTAAYDRRGFGQTQTADEAFSHVEDLHAVLDTLDIPATALVGCSQGGRIAIDFALAYPGRVNALVLIASAISGASWPETLPPDIQALSDELDEADEADDLPRINELEAVMWLDGPTSARGRVSGSVRDLFLDMNGIALGMPELTHIIEPPSAYERVSDLNLPVLVIWGDLDFPTQKEHARYLVESIPGARGVEIPGTAHLPNLEQPQIVNALLRDHLS